MVSQWEGCILYTILWCCKGEGCCSGKGKHIPSTPASKASFGAVISPAPCSSPLHEVCGMVPYGVISSSDRIMPTFRPLHTKLVS